MADVLDEIFYVDVAHKKDFLESSTKDLDTIGGRNNVVDAILRRVATSPGELVHRPEYGVGIQNYLNAPNSVNLQLKLAQDIRVQLERDERIESVKEVSVFVENNDHDKLKVKIKVDLRGIGETDIEEVFQNG